MKEIIVVAIVLFVYFFISYLIYTRLVKAKGFFFVLISSAYLVSTFFLFQLILRIDQYLLTPVFGEEPIRVNEVIIAAFFVCTVTAFINIIAAMARKEKISENAVEEKAQSPAVS
ncbi:MAG TPA: hypothetical protein VKT28_10875 [Puia sp.]|nr:hypothetical protein [Puia sp.]